MKKKEIAQNWLLKAKKDVETAKDLFGLKHYDWSLFIWHLAIEKTLKAKLVAQNKSVPYTHDLSRLVKEANIPFSEEQIKQLNEITTFNIEARYDDYKLSFYKKTTSEYSGKWVKICESIYKLIRRQL